MAEVRGAQSFVGVLSSCWRRPGLVVREVAWRWAIGIPALFLILTQLKKVLLAATGGTLDPASLGLDRALLNDPVGSLSADPLGAAGKFGHALGLVLPQMQHVAVWMLPLLIIAWIIVSSFGRTMVLRCADASLQAAPVTLMLLQAVRMAVLSCVFWVWLSLLGWSTRLAINAPAAAGGEPNLILFCAMVIVISIAMFTAWAFVSWVFMIAPLLAMVRNTSAPASLKSALQLGAVKGKLAEVNLVLAIVKVALVVLAMTFSATPLPFQDVATPTFLAYWWAGIGLLYVLWSDFFHVARLIAYLNLYRAFQSE